MEGISHSDGSQGQIGDIAVRNAYVVPNQGADDCTVQREGPAQLSFTAVNGGNQADRLVAIDSGAAASVRIDAAPEELVLDAGASVAAGQPVTGADAQIDVVFEGPSADVRPGRRVEVTFSFEKAGDMTFAVPVNACR